MADSDIKITSIHIRMYRAGTGDCFILQFMKDASPSFNMMIDCGCITGGVNDFLPIVDDIKEITDGTIDLLVVTHQHADHINGFEKCTGEFDTITFKKVWFAWTEDDTDPIANDYRENHSELAFALNKAATALKKVSDSGYYQELYANERGGEDMRNGKEKFIQSLNALNELNPINWLGINKEPLPTMVEMFKDFKIIKEDTIVECLEPGDVRSNLAGAKGIRFYVLGPPRDQAYLNKTDEEDEVFEKRENKSTIDFAFLSALDAINNAEDNSQFPFEDAYELTDLDSFIKKRYEADGEWRKIDYDWLYAAGSLAMRYERSINNTSLALAIQFEDSQRILLFPGDAELGNWQSWHDGLEWSVKINGSFEKKKVDYFLEKTVFYKVGHHLSHNGTAKVKGIDLMTSPELTAMATLGFNKINKTWLNTMPNDLLGAELIKKTEGKLYFLGDAQEILRNIKTDRVVIKKRHEKNLIELNDKFTDNLFIEVIIESSV